MFGKLKRGAESCVTWLWLSFAKRLYFKTEDGVGKVNTAAFSLPQCENEEALRSGRRLGPFSVHTLLHQHFPIKSNFWSCVQVSRVSPCQSFPLCRTPRLEFLGYSDHSHRNACSGNCSYLIPQFKVRKIEVYGTSCPCNAESPFWPCRLPAPWLRNTTDW